MLLLTVAIDAGPGSAALLHSGCRDDSLDDAAVYLFSEDRSRKRLRWTFGGSDGELSLTALEMSR